MVRSDDPAFKEGDAVLVTGCGLSETRDGGYTEYARIESKWTIPLPAGLSLRESMILGTAGFTAALALFRMQDNRQSPALGPIAVTGATGGVGSLATAIFSRAGYEVHAISGKADQHDYLRQLGASEVLEREVLQTSRALESVRFGGALDNVGGPMPVSYTHLSSTDDHVDPPSRHETLASLVLLLVSLVVVVLSAKKLAPGMEALLAAAGAPPAVIGIVIAAIVLLPADVYKRQPLRSAGKPTRTCETCVATSAVGSSVTAVASTQRPSSGNSTLACFTVRICGN